MVPGRVCFKSKRRKSQKISIPIIGRVFRFFVFFVAMLLVFSYLKIAEMRVP